MRKVMLECFSTCLPEPRICEDITSSTGKNNFLKTLRSRSASLHSTGHRTPCACSTASPRRTIVRRTSSSLARRGGSRPTGDLAHETRSSATKLLPTRPERWPGSRSAQLASLIQAHPSGPQRRDDHRGIRHETKWAPRGSALASFPPSPGASLSEQRQAVEASRGTTFLHGRRGCLGSSQSRPH